MKTITINFGYNTDDVKLIGPEFNQSNTMEKAVVRCKSDYEFSFVGYDENEEDFEEEKHVFQVGEKVALIENYDWNDNLSEFAGEIEFTSEANAYYNEKSGTAHFVVGEKVISFAGEYAPVEWRLKDEINKEFGTNYSVIFAEFN